MPTFEPDASDLKLADRIEPVQPLMAWYIRAGEITRQANAVAFAMEADIDPNRVNETICDIAVLNISHLTHLTSWRDPENFINEVVRYFEHRLRQHVAQQILDRMIGTDNAQ